MLESVVHPRAAARLMRPLKGGGPPHAGVVLSDFYLTQQRPADSFGRGRQKTLIEMKVSAELGGGGYLQQQTRGNVSSIELGAAPAGTSEMVLGRGKIRTRPAAGYASPPPTGEGVPPALRRAEV
jgi:hypothetical protein